VIPTDHFVRYYNEVFKALHERGREHLVAYWRELGRMQALKLAARFREGGLQACYDYWQVVHEEENCEGDMTLTEDYLAGRMDRCPSLSKAMDNDAGLFELYCDHCMAWVEPVMEEAGLYAVMDMKSRTEPHCAFRVYKDKAKADEFERQATLPSHPYEED
jgi:hypothetical protein